MWLPQGIQYSNCTLVTPGKMEMYIRQKKVCRSSFNGPLKNSQHNHELPIAKLNACGFSEPSLKLIYSYLKDQL